MLRNYQRPAGRGFTIFPDDTILDSYPRSGNTWVRFMIASLIEPAQDHDFTSTLWWVPDVYKASDRALRKRPRPRVIKSHEPFDPNYPRTIYITRDPRDVAISYYHYLVHFRPHRPDETFDEFLDDFLRGNVPFGSWSEHVLGWTSLIGQDTFMLLRYEDIKEDPAGALTALASFACLPTDPERILKALDQGSFDRMRHLESQHLGPREEESGRFVRKGKSSGWRDELDEATAARISDAFGEAMAVAGYS